MAGVISKQVARWIGRAALVLACAGLADVASAQREYGGIHTSSTLANMRHNGLNYSWGQQVRASAISAAAWWVARSDDALWHMIPGQEVPRCVDVTWDYNYPSQPRLGCLNCGDAIHAYGNYPYTPDHVNKPWKLTCPSCAAVFPTNDFGAYYQSGIGPNGQFNPALANRALLFNAAYPNPSHPLHKYGVDDGYGYIDSNGRAHKFIGYYTWQYWRYLVDGVGRLSNAYMMTGDKLYARKAAIMLDRIADVYPAMDWNKYAVLGWYHSDGGSKLGKIEGRIWETQNTQYLSRYFDRIISGTVDNPELYTFLAQKRTQYTLPGNKGTRQDFVNNFDTNFLQVSATAIQAKRIWGNEGMHQLSMTMAAMALNTEPKTSQWLDWVFSPTGGTFPNTLVNLFDHDGMADEGGPHYCYLWPSKVQVIAELIEGYAPYTNNVISRDYPWTRNVFRAAWRTQILNSFTPNIGDSGRTGLLSLGFSPSMLAAGFQMFGDPVAARYAWEANGMYHGTLLMDLGQPTPDTMNLALRDAAINYPAEQRFGENMTGYGLASFEFGTNRLGKALWMYYGRSTGHGHRDRLNFGIHAFGVDLAPDLGYPEYMNSTHQHTVSWVKQTISHNTVLVNKLPQNTNWTGYPRFYTTGPGFGAVEVESNNAYNAASEYVRTMAFTEVTPGGNAYAVDFFRVTGGDEHLMSFHGPPGTVIASGITFTPQPTGTYAGPSVAYGTTGSSIPTGFSFLKNVSRAANPPAKFTLDWKAQTGYRGVLATDNIHLRMHSLTQTSDVALADGIPPQNYSDNPASIRYALLNRVKSGSAAHKSQFVSVYEPWKGTPFINNVERCAVTGNFTDDVIAIKVTLAGGITDYFISNPGGGWVQVVDGPGGNGVFGWMRVENDRVVKGSLTRGQSLSFLGTTIQGAGNIHGTLVSFEEDISQPATALIDVLAGDATKIVGEQIVFNNDRQRAGVYDVTAVEHVSGNRYRISCGPGSFIRGFKNATNYSQGYNYNIANGNSFYVPASARYEADFSEVDAWGIY